MRHKLFQFFVRKFRPELDELFKVENATELEKAFRSGYDNAKTHFETMTDQIANLKYTGRHYLVNPHDVFTVSQSNIPYLDLEPINKKLAQELKENAMTLKSYRLWSVLKETVRKRAILNGLYLSDTKSPDWKEQILASKMMIHNIGILESIVNYLADLDVSKLVSGGKDQQVGG